MEIQMTKTDKAIRWAQGLAADVAPNRAADLVEAVKAKAAKWSATTQDSLVDARHRFAHRAHPHSRAEEAAELLRARAAQLSLDARQRFDGVAKSNRTVPVLAIAGVAGGVVLGLAVARMLRRKRLREREADVGTYFTHDGDSPAGEPLFDRPEDAYVAQGAGFEDPTGGEPIPTFGTPPRQ
jgi:hypothetical protein